MPVERILCNVRVNNPVGEAFIPTLEDLRGISFECAATEPIEIRVAGKPVEKGKLDFLTNDDRLVIGFPLQGS